MNSLRTFLVCGLSLMLVTSAPWVLAQDEEAEAGEEEVSETVVEEAATDEEAAAAGPMEEVVVTGSRLKRSTFESISPLQIVNAEISREAGLVDAAEIIQTSTTSADVQIDLTFSGYVLDNGPGASTANLRGLSSDRTLILLNGRRMAPAGVEGAPSNPDLNLIPGNLVAQYDFLLDGASSVYGSDAIAGVVNVKLRKDFNGFEVRASTDNTDAFGPSSSDLSLTWGQNFSRGFVGVGGSFRRDPLIRFEDAPFTRECEKHYEEDQNGNIRTDDVYYLARFGVDATPCRAGGITNIIYGLPFGIGTLYRTDGRTNGGWPNFSESHLFLGGQLLWFDGTGDGLNDVDFNKYWANTNNQYRTLYNEFNQDNVMSYGEYTFEGDMNVTAFFEMLYSNRTTRSETQVPQLFPTLHPLYPFNPCNPLGEGVDCGLARDALLNNPVVVETIQNVFGCTVSTGGTCDQTTGPIGPIPVGIVVRVDGDRHITETDVTQTRYVAGFNADLPFLDDALGLSDWSGETSVTYTSSIGVSELGGIREDKLDLAIGAMSAFGIPCSADAARPGQLQPDTAPGCVPVNLLAPSLWDPSLRGGKFATQAEWDYLYERREFDTRVSQRLLNVYLTGSLFNLPYGSVVAGIGYDHRKDTIDSIPNDAAALGLMWGYSADQGAIGEKTTREFYLEFELPLLEALPMAQELTLNVSGRTTSDEYYGSHPTYSAKVGYRPVNWMLLRSTRGTSYRSPNLRDSFLLQQTGFLNVSDPCVTPEDAFDEATGEYLPSEDRREPIVLTNCELNGVNPRAWGNGGFNLYNIEVGSGGSLLLEPETSDSFSAGMVVEQPWTNAFDLNVGVTYYVIDVDNTIIEPSLGYIVQDCYYSPTSTSPFCGRIHRAADPSDPEIEFVDRGFINRDNDTVRGMDYNVSFKDTVTLFDRPFEISVDLVSHRLIERSTLFINPLGTDDQQDFFNEWGFTQWRHTAVLQVDFADFRFTYRPRYIGANFNDPDSVDDWDNGITGFSDTCYGPPDDVLCRDLDHSEPYINHTVGLRYDKYNWEVVLAIQNVTDEEPPRVDPTEVWSRSNIPLGLGYDFLGRTIFLSGGFRFGGS
ncbi:MAG: TonB-dependent receptor plug domain-containing protein [Gammaproteobacteria bacterium]|nr:TonB-dependent receptor plug domain-containing protein [Gammaproteobacteria bacterium]